MSGVSAVLDVDDFEVSADDGFAVSLPSLHLQRGGCAALYGPSGVGKSRLLAALFGIGRGARERGGGRVGWFGRDTALLPAAERRQLLRTSIGWIAQDAASALDPLQPIGDQMRQATYRSLTDCAAMLTRLGIADAQALLRRLPQAISGGQAQRVLFAVAALRKAELVVADEPTASLDDRTCQDLLELLVRMRDEGSAVLAATHDHRVLQALTPDVLVAKDGVFAPGTAARRTWPAPAGHASGDTVVLRARGLCVRFGERRVLDDFDLDLNRAEIVALVGPSGAGKTTLARILVGARRPDAGVVDRPSRPGAVQMVGQDANGSLTPGRTLRSLLAEAHAPMFDPLVAARQLNLPAAVLDRTAAQMSGGERRRAALLRAMAVNPDVLVLDEPTASLDHATAIEVVETLLGLQQKRGVAMLLITHDAELAAAVGNRIVSLPGERP